MAEKITIEEYNRQKDEYTQQALKELRELMKSHPQSSFKNPEDQKYNENGDNSIDSVDSDVENLIKDRKKRNNRRIKSNRDNKHDSAKSLNEVIYAQRELDMKTIQSLKEMINKIRNELDDECRKNHYLKLGLNNSNCDNSDLKKQIQHLKDENDKNNKVILEYKNKTYRDGINMMIMKIMIVLLMFLVFVW